LPKHALPLTFDLRSRVRAASLHLSASVVVALLAGALVFGLWYPTPFREISGGRELFIIVVAVDAVLGPLLTFAVFDKRKPWRELRRDVAVVVVLQLAGLGYGLQTVFEARPVVLALEGHRLRVVRAIDLDPQGLARAPAEWRRLPLRGVHVLAARDPEPAEKLEAINMALQGVDVGMRPEFWQTSARTAAALLKAAKPLGTLSQRYPQRAAELKQYIEGTGRSAAGLKYLPLMARRTDWVALIDASSGEVVGFAPFDGF